MRARKALTAFVIAAAVSAAAPGPGAISLCDIARADVSLVSQQDSFYWYQEAKYQAVNRRDYKKALEYCDRAVKLNPDNQHAKALRSWLDERIGRLDEIKKKKEELAKPPDAPKTAEVKVSQPSASAQPSLADNAEANLSYYQGLTKLTEGRFDEAAEFFKADLVDNPDRVESWFYLFKYYRDNGDNAVAARYLAKAREKFRAAREGVSGEFARTMYDQCRLYQDEAIIQKGIYKYNQDIDIASEVRGSFDWKPVSQIPGTSEIFNVKRTMAAIDIEKLRGAGAVPKNFSPGEGDFRIDQGGRVAAVAGSFKKRPKIEIALSQGETSQKLKTDVEKLITEGDYYAYIGVYERALAFYDEALSRDPKSPMANNNKGVVMKVKGRLDEAIKYFKLAISCDKTYVEAYNNLATVYSERENYEEALKLFLVAQKLNQNEAGIVFNIGVMYHKLGMLDKAREYVKSAIEMSATADPAYYYQLGQINLKKGNRREAWQNLRKVSTMVEKGSDIYNRVTEILRTFDPQE